MMKRVTYWNDEYGCWSYHCSSGDAAKLLAAYENAMPLERAQKLAQVERDGRMVVLPKDTESVLITAFVNVGDKVNPYVEMKGNKDDIFALLSISVSTVAKYCHTDYFTLLHALMNNPPLGTIKEENDDD